MMSRDQTQHWDRSKLMMGFLIVSMVLYILTFSTLTIRRHQAFESSYFDLGIFDQAVWNTHHGRILATSNITQEAENLLAQHVQPILILISLLYLFYSSPETLLILQCVVIALGALPAFWLARERLENHLAALVFPVIYLLFPALEAANIFDFHPATLAASLILFTFYFLQKGCYPWFFLFALLLMSCQEEMPLLVFMMGLYILLAQGNRRLGMVTMAVAAVWFFVAFFLVIPHFSKGEGSPYLSFYAYLGDNPLEIIATALLKPWLIWQNLGEKLFYVGKLLAPVAFTSLFCPQTLLLATPSLAVNLLSTYPPMNELEKFQYGAPLVPFVIISAVYGVAFLTKRLSERLKVPKDHLFTWFGIILLFSTLSYHRYHGFTPLAVRFPTFRVTMHHRLANELITLIPEEAIVSAQSRLAPHISERERIYLFPMVEDAEYVFFDVSVDSWPIHPNDQKRLLDTLLGEEGFGILAAKDGYILLQHGLANAQELPDEFYDFARVKEPQIDYPMVIDFGGFLRFLGFNLNQKEGLTSLALYWQPLLPLEQDYRIYPFFYDEMGRIIEDTTLRPMTTALWYPTSRWKVGEIVRMETLPWDVGDDFNVGLGVMEGEDWRIVEDRLPLEVGTSALVVSPFEEGTALKLLEVRDGQPVTPRRSFEPPSIPNPFQADLAHKVRLLGYGLTPSTLYSGETLHLSLYWQALAKMEKDYTVFTHLRDKEGRIWGQKDNFPAGGTRPTSGWLVGEIVVDEYDIPVRGDAPPGDYTIEIGMYDLISGERLAAFDAEGERLVDDSVILTKVEVER